MRVAVVVARFYDELADRLVALVRGDPDGQRVALQRRCGGAQKGQQAQGLGQGSHGCILRRVGVSTPPRCEIT